MAIARSPSKMSGMLLGRDRDGKISLELIMVELLVIAAALVACIFWFSSGGNELLLVTLKGVLALVTILVLVTWVLATSITA